MNFVCSFYDSKRGLLGVFALCIFVLLALCFAGCSKPSGFRTPTAEQIREFEKAGPIRAEVDLDSLSAAMISKGSYKVLKDDLLELTMPAILQVITSDQAGSTERVTPLFCRVSESGTITLPVIGEIEVDGKTLSQIESAVVDSHYPRFTRMRPSVVAQVKEYKTFKVSITGAVVLPGVYSLRNDQMSLVSLLMEAGGILDTGAAVIRIIHSTEPSLESLNIPQESCLDQEDVIHTLSDYPDSASESDQLDNLLEDAIGMLDTSDDEIKSKRIFELTFKPDTPAGTFASLANIYRRQENIDEAIEYYRKSLDLDYGRVRWRVRIVSMRRSTRREFV